MYICLKIYLYKLNFFFFENIKYFLTHTHGKRGESFKETYRGVYPKGPNS